jgi:predicted amidohydrolase YtcJ
VTGLAVVGAEVGGRTGWTVRVEGDRIAAVGPDGGPEVRPQAGDRVISGKGGALIPGLHDHHVHLRAAVAAMASVQAGPPDVADEAGLLEALRAGVARAGPGRWVRAVNYHESVAGDLDRHRLDRWVPAQPLRVQHRTGALWVLNSAALAAVRVEGAQHPGIERDEAGVPTGRLWRADDWLAGAVGPVSPPADLLAQLSADAASRGITGFTDADPRRTAADLAAWAELVGSGAVRQRLHLMGPVGLAHHGPLPTTVTVGPVKVLLDDADLPAPHQLVATMIAAHAEGRPVAVHCVTRVQLLVTLAAYEEAGASPGDRIEHGSLVPPEAVGELARLGLTVVTQPNFVAERGDQYLTDVDPADRDDLYRCRSLLAAGVAVAFGTDHPYGGADPWPAVAAAVDRRAASGAPVVPGEAVDARRALAGFTGRADAPGTPRRLAPGEPADLCLLDRPLDHALDRLPSVAATVTVAAGRIVYQA